MTALNPGETFGPDEPVLDLPVRVLPVLSQLLESGAPRVILREDGKPAGYLDLKGIQAATVPHVADEDP
jgi:hypothetical protein